MSDVAASMLTVQNSPLVRTALRLYGPLTQLDVLDRDLRGSITESWNAVIGERIGGTT